MLTDVPDPTEMESVTRNGGLSHFERRYLAGGYTVSSQHHPNKFESINLTSTPITN